MKEYLAAYVIRSQAIVTFTIILIHKITSSRTRYYKIGLYLKMPTNSRDNYFYVKKKDIYLQYKISFSYHVKILLMRNKITCNIQAFLVHLQIRYKRIFQFKQLSNNALLTYTGMELLHWLYPIRCLRLYHNALREIH